MELHYKRSVNARIDLFVPDSVHYKQLVVAVERDWKKIRQSWCYGYAISFAFSWHWHINLNVKEMFGALVHEDAHKSVTAIDYYITIAY